MGKEDKSIAPKKTGAKNALYDVPNKSESAKKISEIVTKSNIMLQETLGHRIDIHNLEQLADSTAEYFSFCAEHGIMPSFRRLCNWFGYSYKHLYTIMDKQSPEGRYLDQIRDAIKDNLEQAALVNAVNNISAMFILKTQHDYVEATKVVLEPSQSLLGQPKSPDEIAQYIEADIVED